MDSETLVNVPLTYKSDVTISIAGGVAERSKALVLKTSDGLSRPRVRIPAPPPLPPKYMSWMGPSFDNHTFVGGGICLGIAAGAEIEHRFQIRDEVLRWVSSLRPRSR